MLLQVADLTVFDCLRRSLADTRDALAGNDSPALARELRALLATLERARTGESESVAVSLRDAGDRCIAAVDLADDVADMRTRKLVERALASIQDAEAAIARMRRGASRGG